MLISMSEGEQDREAALTRREADVERREADLAERLEAAEAVLADAEERDVDADARDDVAAARDQSHRPGGVRGPGHQELWGRHGRSPPRRARQRTRKGRSVIVRR